LNRTKEFKFLSTNGFEVIIDLTMKEKITKYKWWVLIRNNRPNSVYRSTRVQGKNKTIRISRELLGKTEGMVIDHINNNPLDNRISNLRFCTLAQNSQNRKSHIKKYKGVYWQKADSIWIATIQRDNKKYHLGSFKTQIEASVAYNKAAIKLHGNYAKLNKIKAKHGEL